MTLEAREIAHLPAPIGRRVIRLALRRAGLRGRDLAKGRIDEILALAARQGTNAALSLPEAFVARLEYGRLILSGDRHAGDRPAPPPRRLLSPLPVPGEVIRADLGLSISARLVPKKAVEEHYRRAPPQRAYVDAASLDAPLIVRAPRPGDRLRPLGAPGTRKLSDLWTDLKVPREARRRSLLVESGGRIVWVAGLRLADRFRVTSKTARVVVFELAPHPAPAAVVEGGGDAAPAPEAIAGPPAAASEGAPAAAPGEQPVAEPRAVLYGPGEIAHAVDRLAVEVARWAGDQDLLVIGILSGSFIFLADLVRRLPGPLRVGFVDREGTHVSRELPLAGARVLLVEDILDTGESLARVLARLRESAPAEVRTCVLFEKMIENRKVPLTADFVGLTVPDRWVVGYGLDHEGRERNLPYLTSI